MSSHATRRARPAPRVTVLGVLGELLITAGLLVLLFLGWQLWFNDLVVGGEQRGAALELQQDWAAGSADGSVVAPGTTDFGPPVVGAAPPETESFATLYVPRFGADYVRPIAEGVGTRTVLNTLGIGHYPGTQMPGEVGNFAIAAHRTTYGAPFASIADLRLGDPIVVRTADGWYTYRFRTMDYVPPSGVEVLNAVPALDGAEPTDRIITLTSCNPRFSSAERIIAYGVFDSWRPNAAGPPPELSGVVDPG
ncbi:class E sortase [Planctomonas psychrotolerans]|uniref:class E sortase n=1 Tax=Planctomonas psychrotolerans TaxID=2528712 RepID=UPI0012389C45|nr:class E sortase [Planctomonas psychrotolerans]